jgi:acetyl esterase/lipase
MMRSQPRPAGTPTIEEQRAGYEAFTANLPIAQGVAITPTTAGGVPCEFVVAPGADPNRVLIYFHGGGYVIGNLNTHRSLCSELAAASGIRVLAVDYRLAPEHPFPAAVEDAVAVYQSLVESGYAPSALALGGDSAGGGLTAAACIAIRDRGLPTPACAIMLSPWTDLSLMGPSMNTRAELDPMVQRAGVEAMAATYLNGASNTDPLASPLYADLAGFPPSLIQVGTYETLYDDADGLKNRLQAAGRDVTFEPYEGQVHVFQAFAATIPEAREAVTKLGAFVASHTSA